jgi:hypothetical protein
MPRSLRAGGANVGPVRPNRRNYYRVLHVQPEAPVDVIRASYRVLMGPLRHHPDKGGDPATAALINEACAVLTDPARRRAYDAALGDLCRRARSVPVAPNTGAKSPATPAARRVEPPVVRPDPGRCAFCSRPAPPPRRAGQRCTRCDAPLAPPPGPRDATRELVGRRAARRVPKDHPVILLQGFGAKPLRATLRDLSATGLRLLAPIAVPAGTVLRVTNAELDAVALVVSCRRSAHQCLLHAELLAADFAARAGVLVATTA